MSSYKFLRLIVAVFVLVVMVGDSSVVFGQDDSGMASADTGTPGLTKALDDLNLPPVPPAPPANNEASETPSPTITPPSVPPDVVCTCNPAAPARNRTKEEWEAFWAPSEYNKLAASLVSGIKGAFSAFNIPKWDREMAVLINMPSQIGISFGHFARPKLQTEPLLTNSREPAFQSGETFHYDGFTVTIMEDGRFEFTADDGTMRFNGRLGIVGKDRIIIQGIDDHGIQYAIADKSFMASTPDGNALIGNGTTTYIYRFDKTGALVGLSDSDGRPYTVETDGSGTTSIKDADGITSTFAEDGSFVMADADGKVLEESSLYGDDESTVDDGAPTQEAGDQSGSSNDSGSGESDHSGEAGSGESGG